MIFPGVYAPIWQLRRPEVGLRPSRSTAAPLLRQFVSGEEVTEFKTRRIVGVGAVHGILLDARCPLLADGAIVGLRGIGSAHQFAVVDDSVLLLQRNDNDRAARHEVGKRFEK